MPRRNTNQRKENDGPGWGAFLATGLAATGLVVAGTLLGYATAETLNNDERKSKDTPCTQHAPQPERNVSQTKTAGTDKTDKECAICLEDLCGEVAFVPCGHCGCCGDCSSQLRECPFCRTPIQSRHRIYRP